MFEGRDMFKTTGGPEKKEGDLYHLAHMIALLGPPPADLLKRGTLEELGRYFDEQGEILIFSFDLCRSSFDKLTKIALPQATGSGRRACRTIVSSSRSGTWRARIRLSSWRSCGRW